MHKIDHPTATPGGLFTIGDPVGAVPATVVTEDWLNAVQGELVAVIEGAGLALDKPDNAQLLAAIQALIPPPASAWRTGDVKLTMLPTPEAGWISCNDGTIGNAGSSASTRANADCEALFTLLWNNVSNTYAPVSGGRGASAAADWAADKTIGLTKMLGRALGVAGAGASLTARALGQTVGAETHTLSQSEMPSHTHQGGNTINNGSGYSVIGAGGTNVAMGPLTTSSAGSGTAHNNMQPTTFLYAHIKL
ncbi:tail collar domain [Bordetella phage PY223]